MIDEKKLIEELQGFANSNEMIEYITAYDVVQDCIGIVEKQPKTDWIPCEERLPSEKGFYLATVKRESKLEVFCLFYQKEYWLCDQEEIGKIIAWTNLPQPYKKEGAE